jgi:hypothetical protein
MQQISLLDMMIFQGQSDTLCNVVGRATNTTGFQFAGRRGSQAIKMPRSNDATRASIFAPSS